MTVLRSPLVGRRRLAVLGVVATLTLVVAAHHIHAGDLAMPAMDHAAMVICLGVLVGAAGLARSASVVPLRRLLPWLDEANAATLVVQRPITAPARAGPEHLQVLRL